MKFKKTHYLSGIIITIFIALHLGNHLISFQSVNKHIETMRLLRLFYRNSIIELVILSTVLIQIVSGLKLFIRAKKTAINWFDKVQIYAGLYLSLFIVIHVTAVIIGRLVLSLDTNIYFGAAGINTFPFNLFFIPYYALAIMSYFCHVAGIHNKKMNKNILGLTPINQSIGIILLGILVIILIFYGLTNHFNGMIIPKEYKLN